MGGLLELVLILAILVIVFGATKLPKLGEAVGRAIHNFKSSSASRSDIQIEAPNKGDETDTSS